jgi:Fe-S-cluster containining protein
VIDAGDFGAWLAGMVQALDGARDAEVPCGPCTACCTSSHFVHVEPDELDALAHIPASVRFPAPGRAGQVMGYDEHGRCPMFVDGACSIYDHRPRACRTYDCRVFAAAGVEPDRPAIAERAVRWRFRHGTGADRLQHDEVIAAADRLAAATPASPTERAVLAVREVAGPSRS